MTKENVARLPQHGRVTLKTLAAHVGLTPGTVSAVLNNAPYSKSIPAPTKQRIFAAAGELGYQPNFFARSLRTKRSYTVSVLADDLGDARGALVMAGIEQHLREQGYFLMTGIHRHSPEALEEYSAMLLQRGVEGFITINLDVPHAWPLPTVAVEIPEEGPETRQRLERMGSLAARSLLEQIAREEDRSLKMAAGQVALDPPIATLNHVGNAPPNSP